MTEEIKLDSKFFKQYLDQIEKAFTDKHMCIIKCLDNNGEDTYVLCALTPVENSLDYAIIPVAMLFSQESPYQLMAPAGENSIVATQKKTEPIKINAASPRAFSVN